MTMATLTASSSLAADEAVLTMQRSRGYWASAALRFTRDPVAVGAALVVLLLIALAVFGPWLAPGDP
jgi:peptide/nickel transport system permease protein